MEAELESVLDRVGAIREQIIAAEDGLPVGAERPALPCPACGQPTRRHLATKVGNRWHVHVRCRGCDFVYDE